MEPSQLNIVQRWMQDALVAPDKLDLQSLTEILLPGAQLDVAGCLAIYQRSYTLRLRKCLAEQFRATRYALGDTLFDDFADAYLQACPSDSYTLNELGRRFPGWIEDTRPDHDQPEAEREDWINFMVDLANYERVLFQCFDAPGHEGQPWPDTKTDDRTLILQPCLVLATYRYPVAWYYHGVRDGQSPSYPSRSPLNVVVVRRDYQTTTYPISALHYRFLTATQLLGSVESALADIAVWAQRSIEAVTQSWITEVRSPWIEAGFFIARAD